MSFRVIELTLPYLSDQNSGITQKINAFIAEINQAQSDTVIRIFIDVLPRDVRSCLTAFINQLPDHVIGIDCTSWEPKVYNGGTGLHDPHPTATPMLLSLLPERFCYLNLSGLNCSDEVLDDVLNQIPFKQLAHCDLSNLDLECGGVLNTLHQAIERHEDLAQLSFLNLSHNNLSQIDSVQMSEFILALFILCPDITINLSGNYLLFVDGDWYLPGQCYFVELLGSMIEYNRQFNACVKLQFEISLQALALLAARRYLLAINEPGSNSIEAFLMSYTNLHVDLRGCIDEQVVSIIERDVYAVLSKAYHLGIKATWEPRHQLYFLLNHLPYYLDKSPREFLAECRRLPFSALSDVATWQLVACGERLLAQWDQFVGFEDQVAVAALLPGLLLLGYIRNMPCRQGADDEDAYKMVLEGRIHAGITSLMQVVALLRCELERPSRAMRANPQFEVSFLFAYQLAQKLVERIFECSPLRSVTHRHERLQCPSPLDSVYWESRLWSSGSLAVAASTESSDDGHLLNLMS